MVKVRWENLLSKLKIITTIVYFCEGTSKYWLCGIGEEVVGLGNRF